MNSENRLHAFDAVRATALLLGVLLHALQPYMPGQTNWAIADSSTSMAAGSLVFVIHIFRMTTFFIISGFFARLVYHRRSLSDFVKNRAIRIVVPLVVSWIVFYPIILWLWASGAKYAPLPFARLVQVIFDPKIFTLFHLWFLYTLVLLYLITIPARMLFVRFMDNDGVLRSRVDALLKVLVSKFWGPMVLAIPVIVFLYMEPNANALFGIPTPLKSLIPITASLVAYGAAFVFGWLLNRQPDTVLKVGASWRPYLIIGAIFAFITLALLFPTLNDHSGSVWLKSIYVLCYGGASWYVSLAMLGMALHFFVNYSKTWRYLADSSYWIYIVHIPPIVVMQVLLARLQWNWSVKALIVLVVCVPLLFLSYEWLVRYTFIGAVLNGRRQRSPATEVGVRQLDAATP
jgi:peptidoglycan/LPS O-acetylase OafA/YrhL